MLLSNTECKEKTNSLLAWIGRLGHFVWASRPTGACHSCRLRARFRSVVHRRPGILMAYEVSCGDAAFLGASLGVWGPIWGVAWLVYKLFVTPDGLAGGHQDPGDDRCLWAFDGFPRSDHVHRVDRSGRGARRD